MIMNQSQQTLLPTTELKGQIRNQLSPQTLVFTMLAITNLTTIYRLKDQAAPHKNTIFHMLLKNKFLLLT